jgi:hypothetical protein
MVGVATVLYLLGFRWYDHDVMAAGRRVGLPYYTCNPLYSTAMTHTWLYETLPRGPPSTSLIALLLLRAVVSPSLS